MGKGSNRRPSSVSNAEFERRWAETFRRTTVWDNEYWHDAVSAAVEYEAQHEPVKMYRLTTEEQRNLLGLKQ